MDGKICVVTGATSGIGKEIARDLARRGAHVAFVCRNRAKGEATLTEIGARDMFVADLSDLEQVRRVAGELHDRYDHIDVLVNNAGVQLLRGEETAGGFDAMVATNHLGPFLLTNLLLDRVTNAPGRIVTVASEAHRSAGRIDLDQLAKPGAYGRARALRLYSTTKLLNILFTEELADRLRGTGATANCLCPGLVATSLVRDVRALEKLGRAASRTPLIRTPAQGARMAIRLATDPSLADVSGEFFTSTPGMRRLPKVSRRKDPEFRREVWNRTAALVGLDT